MMRWKWTGAALLLGTLATVAAIALAGGITDPSDPLDPGAGVGPTAPSQPGSIAGSASAYYGPFKCFGARGVVFFVTTTDADSLASATVELSDDNLKWYAVSAAVGSNGTVTSVNLANKVINGRVARVTYFPTNNGGSANPWSTVITDRFIKLKLTANGNQVDGVAVKPIMLYDDMTIPDINAAVYDWALPS